MNLRLSWSEFQEQPGLHSKTYSKREEATKLFNSIWGSGSSTNMTCQSPLIPVSEDPNALLADLALGTHWCFMYMLHSLMTAYPSIWEAEVCG